jgi:ferritin-like metal-binding protein YciE
MPTASTLQELFLTHLQDIYHGEKQILKALPKMAKNATTPELKQAFEKHHDQTEGQVERLQRIFELMNKSARGKTCEAIEGLVEEGKEVMTEAQSGEVMDAGLIAAAQAVEHYEIARYGTLRSWAEQLGMKEAAKLLGETLAEEKQTDELLNKIAKSSVNRKAA